MPKIRLLRIVIGGNISEIEKKFGNIEFFKTDKFSEQCEFNIRLNPDSNKDQIVLLDKDFYVIEIFNKNKYTRQIKYLTKLLELIYKHKINIIHSNTAFLYGIIPLFSSKLTGLPFCVSIHADYEQRESLQKNVIPRIIGSRKLTVLIEKFIYKHADRVLPIRESMIPALVNKGVNKEKIRVFPHSMDLTEFDKDIDENVFRSKYNIPANKKIFSMVGRLEKENYIYDYIDIARLLSKKRKDWVLVMGGGGNEFTRVKEKIRRENLGSLIILPGFINHADVIALRKISHVNLCLMAGFSLIESCAAGRPVIAYDVEWHYELVKNNKTGYLVNENDVYSIAEKLNYLLEDSAIADELGKEAKKLAFERHSHKKVSEIKEAIYRELLSA